MIICKVQRIHTPWLDIQSDDRLGSRLYLASLLLVVLSKTLGLEFRGSLVLLLVVTAEEIDIIIVLLGGRSLSGVYGKLALLRAVGGGLLAWVTRKRGELALEGEDVVVPAPCVRVLLGGGDGLDLLEDLDIGLGGGVAVVMLGQVAYKKRRFN